MNKKEELQKLIDAIKNGLEKYPNLKHIKESYVSMNENKELSGACAIGFACLGSNAEISLFQEYGFNKNLQFPILDVSLSNLKVDDEDISDETIGSIIVTWNDNNELSIEQIISNLEKIKERL